MKFLAKLAVVVLILGGILFAAGHAMGGSVYSAWYNGALHPFREAFSIGWSSWQNERGDIVNDAKDAARDALDDARQPFRRYRHEGTVPQAHPRPPSADT